MCGRPCRGKLNYLALEKLSRRTAVLVADAATKILVPWHWQAGINKSRHRVGFTIKPKLNLVQLMQLILHVHIRCAGHS